MIETPRTLIRRFLYPDDVDGTLEFLGDPEIARYEAWDPYTREQVEAELLDYSQRPVDAAGAWSDYAIVLRATGQVIGSVSVFIDLSANMQFEIGYRIARPFQGKGLGREAVAGLLRHAARLGAHRIFARVDPQNAGSIKLLESVGMRREGYFREDCLMKGKWSDEYVYAVLASELPPEEQTDAAASAAAPTEARTAPTEAR